MTQQITPLPPPPQRGSAPDNFSATADAFLAALPAFSVEANALGLAIEAARLAAATSAGSAQHAADAAGVSALAADASADAAAASAATAVQATGAAEAVANGAAADAAASATAAAAAAADAADSASAAANSADAAQAAADLATGGAIDDTATGFATTWSSARLAGELAGRQETLESGVNLRTVGGQSLLGEGDLPMGGGARDPQPVIDHGEVATAGAQTVQVDVGASDFQLLSMSTANATGTLTIDFVNIPDTVDARVSWHVRLQRGGRKVVAFTPAVSWAGGVAPTFGSAANTYDVIMFYKVGSEGIRAMLIDAW